MINTNIHGMKCKRRVLDSYLTMDFYKVLLKYNVNTAQTQIFRGEVKKLLHMANPRKHQPNQ